MLCPHAILVVGALGLLRSAIEQWRAQLQEMSADQWRALEALRDHGDVTDDNAQVDDDESYGAWDVLNGTQPLDISHGGGELQELTHGIAGDFWNA
ncbi:uncharacterized protein F5891DRAFT_1190591 [Suillus fuscotomentosus]|uniref:Uncharacterized protein n=1 Tax=Suillus fuscotomentosus TaxID=1912939 RepID=A0AAD4E3W0_9AGAM|nr:uncharacterized protein F5891DRAFT_1190591 [Suillus fuscotomentosus]KAG1898801.1 hypothetical protein F5891DRAFT_1190591 [Suillus fuscotomentosus]